MDFKNKLNIDFFIQYITCFKRKAFRCLHVKKSTVNSNWLKILF